MKNHEGNEEKLLPPGSTVMTGEKELPVGEPEMVAPAPKKPSGVLSGTPSAAQQSWGAVISIIIIVLMIIIGALYAWGERIAQERALISPGTEL